MSEDLIRDLAIAYAQAKLLQYQQEHPDMYGYDEEIRIFLKAYYHASRQIPIENEDLDEHF